MRLVACVGLLLCAGCAHLPERVRVEVDGRVVEVSARCPDDARER